MDLKLNIDLTGPDMRMDFDLSGCVNPDHIRRPEGLVACFTGHRPKDLHGYAGREPYQPIINFTRDICEALSRAGVRTFISGGAQGFDQLAFWAVNSLRASNPRLANTVYVPFGNQPGKWSAQGPFSQSDYQIMLQHATDVRILADNPPDGDTGAAARLLHARNHAMVDASDIVIALLTGPVLENGVQNAKGGTAECVRYAISRGVLVITLEYRPDRNGPFTLAWL